MNNCMKRRINKRLILKIKRNINFKKGLKEAERN